MDPQMCTYTYSRNCIFIRKCAIESLNFIDFKNLLRFTCFISLLQNTTVRVFFRGFLVLLFNHLLHDLTNFAFSDNNLFQLVYRYMCVYMKM